MRREYRGIIDEASKKVQEARELFMQSYDGWDFDWCRDKFDGVQDALEIMRGFLDEED